MPTGTGFLVVFIGAGIGGGLRHAVNLGAMRLGLTFPAGTLAINVIGSLVMGLIAEYFAFRSYLPPAWRLFLMTGILGGFTTFSAFSAESLGLIQRGDWGLALLHSAAHLLGALACTALGYAVARSLLP